MTTLTKKGDICVLTIEGELNKATVEQFEALVAESASEDARDFVVDFTDCTGVDSMGLEALTRLRRSCEENLGMVRFCMLSETMTKILEITRLDKKLELCITLEDALAALQ